MSAVREAIERAVGEDGVVEEGDPFVDGAVARDRGGAAVALHEDVVEVAGLASGRRRVIVENAPKIASFKTPRHVVFIEDGEAP